MRFKMNFRLFSIIISNFLNYSLINCMVYKSNITDLSKCSVSYSRSGSTYKDFYPVEIHENASLILDYHFAVLATSDAHILLAESENVSKNDPAYEIVIGAGGNTFCDIRRMQKSDVRHSVRIKNLLSALDPHFFWLHITNNGSIEVGREGENASFIDWLDPEPLPVRFISFSTWSGIEAKWYFNCDRSQSEEELEKRMTTSEKLRKNILIPYDPLVRPVTDQATITKLFMTLNLDYLELDEYKSTIEIQGTATMRWHDEKLNWDPTDYDNVTQMPAYPKEIWTPKMTCFSSLNNSEDILRDAVLTVTNTGEVEWRPVIHLKAFCDGIYVGDWPKDIHSCKILFGFAVDYGSILLNFSDSDSSLLQQGQSQWLILEASVFDIQTNNNSTNDTPSFGFYFKVRRSSAAYSIIFFMPFIVIGLSLLFSFWTSPKSNIKLYLCCSQLIMETIMLVALAYFVPRTSGGVPFLIALYSWCLVGSLISIIISVAIINIFKNKQAKPLPHVVCNMLTKPAVKKLLFLPSIMMPEDYGDLDISLSLSNISRVEDKGQRFWALLAIAINRLAFYVYALFIIIATVKYVVSSI